MDKLQKEKIGTYENNNGSYFVFGEDTVQCGCYGEPSDILLLKYQDVFVVFAELPQPYD